MQSLRVLFVFAMFLVGNVATGSQPDVRGEWMWTMPGPDGNPVEATLTLVENGAKLSGSFTFGGGRKLQIEEGNLEGSDLRFIVKRDRPGGGTMIYRMKGSVEGNTMKGTAETDMEGTPVNVQWSAKRK